MNFLIQFLLASCLLFIIGEAFGVAAIEKTVKHHINHKMAEEKTCAYGTIYEDPSEYQLFLRRDAKISENDWSLYWKGVNNDDDVLTVKLNTNGADSMREAKILEYLRNQDPNLQEHGIPKIYFHGNVFGTLKACAFTLLHGSLIDVRNLYKKKNLKLSELSLLILIRGAVKALKFLSEHNVVHNNVQPENIFVYCDKVFLCGFDIATGPGDEPHLESFPPLASSNWHKSLDTSKIVPRTPMDDFEHLIFSMWTFAGMRVRNEKSDSMFISECHPRAHAETELKERCDFFKDVDVRAAFKELIHQMVSESPVPDYNQILTILDTAISTIEAKSKPEKIDWMGRFTVGAPFKDSKYSKRTGISFNTQLSIRK